MSLLAQAGLPRAEVIDKDGALRINIYRKNGDKSAINVSEKDPRSIILAYMETHEEVTTREISELIGLKELEENGKIEPIGANKNRRYRLFAKTKGKL